MPYGSVSEAERKNPGLKKYSDKAKRGWLSSFNSCMKDGGKESKCFAIAYAVANKADGRRSSSEGTEERVARIASSMVVAMSFVQEAKAMKLKSRAADFYQDVKDFKGSLNSFLADLQASVRNPRALAAFPEVRDVVELSEFLKRGVLKHTFLSDAALTERMMQVVEADASA